MNQKDFLEACEAKIGMQKLTPRERLVFLVVSWLDEAATRKDICTFTGISKAHLSTIIGQLKAKQLLSTDKVVKSVQNGSMKVSNTETSSQYGNSKVSKMETNLQNGNTKVSNTETSFQYGDVQEGSLPNNNINNNINKINNNSACTCTYEASDAFLAFWERYPHKQDKLAVQAKWEALMAEGYDAAEIMAGLERSIAHWEKTFDGMKFIPYPLKWLNGGRWMDEVSTPLVFEKKATGAVVSPGVKSVPVAMAYSADEEAFLKAYGKKPRGAEDVELFHRAFQRALAEAGSIEVLCKAAVYAVEDCQYFEGTTQKMKRASYWLDDCDYRQWLDRARQAVGFRPQPKAPDMADKLLAAMGY